MTEQMNKGRAGANRRSFLRGGIVAAGAATLGAQLVASGLARNAEAGGGAQAVVQGDIDILRFLAALETIESDLWQQYNELGGIQDSEVPGGSGNEAYTDAIEKIDDDMPQYIHDNTDDEISHFTFLNAFVQSLGGTPVNLDQFRTLPSSKATGAQQIGRLTNLMQLTVDTSWWTRYRSDNRNPDPPFNDTFAQAVPTLNVGQHPGIPRSDADLTDPQIQSIANTAAFHFAFIEQGGTSLYPALAQRVTNPEVLRVLLSIGPTETMHFQTWSDTAGHAVSPPLNVTFDGLVFPDLSSAREDLNTSLIMPEPTVFLNRSFPIVSIIRPTDTNGAAAAAVQALTTDGLFIGQSPAFFAFLNELAAAADRAQRGG